MEPCHRPSRARGGAQVSGLCLLFGFAFTVSGQIYFERLRSFGFVDQLGDSPAAGLLAGSDGKLYGTARSGGTENLGTLFRVQKDGAFFEVLHNFSGGSGDGKSPFAGLIEASDGLLYGTTYAGGNANGGVLFKINRNGSG